ncbi:11379_t:CDS:2, partial [Dentiscutata erythropus]
EEKTRLWNEINSIPMDLISSPLTTAPISQAASEANLTSAVHHLILSYLVHHGYSDTAKTFSRNTVQLPQIDNSEMEGVESENPLLDKDKDMINRQRIRDAVLAGDIDHAIKLTNTFYPSDAMDVDEFAASTSDDSIDDLFGVSSVKKKTSKRQKNVWSGLHGLDGIMAEALKFGYKLQDDYRDDYRDEIKNTLKDAFSLLAYTDPRRSCVSHLLDPSGREPVANSLNSAILVSQGKPAIPPLEKAYRQASVVLRELSRNSVGSSAFVNVRQDCLV